MHYNEDFPSDIVPLMPQGTNSTMFTQCCDAAICDDERVCPVCRREVVGANAETDHERGRIRWKNATRLWKRNKSNERIT